MADDIFSLLDVWPEGAESTGIARALTVDERNQIDDSDFAWPDAEGHPKFPIDSQSHLDSAAKLLGHAPEEKQAQIKARIKTIAKRKGFALPDAWVTEDTTSKERAMATPANHDPFSGSHSHAHPAFGSQGDDETHTHEHSHDNDAEHGHSHADDDKSDPPQDRSTPATIQTSDRPTMYAPFLRIDAAKREVVGQATAEVPDSYGTIFGYYPPAWEKWRGNIREQHDPKKAVGSKVDYFPNEELRLVDLHSRVSRGAQDTWLKVEDNVLTGYSLSVIPDAEFGNDTKRWPRKEYQGKEYPYLPRYSIAEVSLVDNPACPGCDIAIVRADGVATDVLDVTEDEPVAVEPKQEQRAGARIGSATKEAMHKSIAHTLHAATAQMSNCGCPTCVASQKAIDPDGDGDIDLGGYDDPDGDSDAAFSASGAMPDDMVRAVTDMIERSLQPAYARLQGIAGTLSRNSSFPLNIESLVTSSIDRAIETLNAKLADLPTKASLAEVHTELSVVKERVVAIAEQPMPGGPVLNASVVEKRLATDPPQHQTAEQQRQSYGAVYEAIRNLANQGGLDTTDKQVDAMAAGLAAQRGGR
jgi:hypothetical protein